MDKKISEYIKVFNRALFISEDRAPSAGAILEAFSATTGSAALLVDRYGALLEHKLGGIKPDGRFEALVLHESFADNKEIMTFLKASETVHNEPFSTGDPELQAQITIIPVPGQESPSVSFILYTLKKPLDASGLLFAEMTATLLGVVLLQAAAEKEEEEERNRALAEGAFESLSYSEVEAIQEILKNIDNNESVVVASKIADRLGITRSVIVNALRKFESAGIIESRSLGMKGTFIRVKNKHALEMIASRSERMGYFT